LGLPAGPMRDQVRSAVSRYFPHVSEVEIKG
jgi:hypothetical protein